MPSPEAPRTQETPAKRLVPQGKPLRVVRNLFARWDAEGVAYCHWKSNEHLDAALEGNTDLDVLVARDHAPAVVTGLTATGFKRFPVTPSQAYPAVEDHMGFDEETGRLVHVHLHYELTLGEPHLKSYRIPWEAHVLGTRRQVPEKGTYVSHPDSEMALLLVRAALKVVPGTRLKRLLGKAYPGADVLREFEWLQSRADPEAVTRLVERTFGEAAAREVAAMVAEGPSLRRLVAFRRRAKPWLRLYRTYRPLDAWLRVRVRKAYNAYAGISRKYAGAPIPSRKTDARGGRIIAILGSDGAGKSTAAEELTEWLTWKLDAFHVYMGTGKGAMSLPRRPLARLRHRLYAGRPQDDGPGTDEARRRTGDGSGARKRSLLRRFLGTVEASTWAFLVARERRQRLLIAHRARNRGMIVVCDRYPQNVIAGYNDGPLLEGHAESPSKLLRALQRWERAPYDWPSYYPPDLVLRLNVSLDVAQARRPETSRSVLERKISGVRAVTVPPGTRLVDVDADAPLEEVRRQVRKAVWQVL